MTDYISDNKKIGVLPHDIIDNSKISTISKIKKNSNNYMNADECKYKLKKGLKQEKDYIIINQHLWEWFSLNYNGGPELKLLSEKTYIPSSLAPIKEHNEINHNEKMHDENKNNNTQINKNNKKLNNNYKSNKDENISKLKQREKLNKFENDKNKLEFEKIFNEKEFDKQQPSYSESEELNDISKNASLDSSSNKINSINRYTFNTKFCDFNNSKNNKNENFEDAEFFSKIMAN